MRRLPVVVLFAIFWQVAICQFKDDCSDAPNAVTKKICSRLRKGDAVARKRIARQTIEKVFPPSMPGSPVWQQPVMVPANARGQIATHPYDCMTLLCLCPFFGGLRDMNGNCMLQNGNPLQMAYRKEYRVMTDDERARFHSALNVLKRSGEYDRLSAEHQLVGTGSGAHSGPGFLPWHREFLKRVEIALRLIDPSLAIPYWDSVMEGYLEDPRDSILFSNDFIGETDFNGFVLSGPFAYWRTLEGRPYIMRALGREGQLFTEQQVNQVMEQTNVEYVLAYTVPLPGCPYPTNYGAIEYSHSNIHLWLGGDMSPPTTSANDPIFYMHHSFVDHIWENWRQLRQPRFAREAAFTPDLPQCASAQHFSYAQMRPFNLVNRDGLSNSYTDQMYRYGPRPTCTVEAPSCGSKYLFCDTRGRPHCVAKVKLGGLCSRFMGFDVCYMGRCVFGRCSSGPTPPPFVPLRQQPKVAVTRQPFVNCFNRNPCCDSWAARGECNSNKKYMSTYCRVSCKICTPSFNVTNECANRHVSCIQWQQNGECRGNSQMFMQENCRQQCSFCGMSKASQCQQIPRPPSRAGTHRKNQTPKPHTPFALRQ